MRRLVRVLCSSHTYHAIYHASDEMDEYHGLRPVVVGNRFENPWKKWETPSVGALIKWKCFNKNHKNLPKIKRELDAVLPIIPIDKGKLLAPPDDKIQVMWIGHATVLVQFDGITILTDPVFRDDGRLKGRFRPAPCNIEDIPKLDAVIISHDHYDHFHEPSMEALNKRFPDLHWYVGKGFSDLLARAWRGGSSRNVHEMTWWDKHEFTPSSQSSPLEFICAPAQHWCRRGLFDENKRLWCSWIVKGPTKSFFFPGDTGYYQPVFQKIGEKFGPFDLAALPIGAYEPRYFLEYQHVDPEEAVKIHVDIKAKFSIGIHWGTYPSGMEWYLEPPQKLKKEMEKMNVNPETFQCLNHGEIWAAGERRETPAFMSAENPTEQDE